MRIAIHNPRASYFLGGSETTAIEFAKILSKEHEINFVTSNNQKSQNFSDFEENFPNVTIRRFKCPKHTELSVYGKINVWDLEGLFFGEITSDFYEKNSFDLVLVFYSADLVTLNKKNMKTSIYLQGYPKERKILDEVGLSKADSMICCSKHVLKEMNSGFGMKLKEVYYPAPDVKSFVPKELERDIEILYLGRLTERKGADLLVESLKLIEDNFCKCIIAGTGEIEKKVRSLIKRYNLDNKIKLIGPVEKGMAIELLNRSKIFVLPARSREPYPNTIMEAMCMGAAVVSTFVGGIPEIVKSNKEGILVEPGNVKDLSNAINDLLLNPGKLQDISNCGKKKMNRMFNPNKKEKELLELYSWVMDEKND